MGCRRDALIVENESLDALASFFGFAFIFGIGRLVSYLLCDAFRNATKQQSEIQYETG
jgi:hypothetical protein